MALRDQAAKRLECAFGGRDARLGAAAAGRLAPRPLPRSAPRAARPVPLPPRQAFTSIAKDVMTRLQQEQVDQQAASALSPIKLTSQLDRAKQRKKKSCCDS